MKLEINDIQGLKDFINSLSVDKDEIYINEGLVTQSGNGGRINMPKRWVGKKVKYIVMLSD
jgi:putative transposon-encoded protein